MTDIDNQNLSKKLGAKLSKNPNKKLRVAVFISGGGSNLQALIDSCVDKNYPVEIVCVVSNVADAYGLQRAKKVNIPTIFVDHKKYNSRKEFDFAIDKKIAEFDVDIICLAGFMRLLSKEFVEKWQGCMLNIHPSLLPSFKGADANGDAIKYGVKISGCTVHFVVPEMDAGPIILQRSVEVASDDTRDSLAAKVLEQEHIAYPQALKIIYKTLTS